MVLATGLNALVSIEGREIGRRPAGERANERSTLWVPADGFSRYLAEINACGEACARHFMWRHMSASAVIIDASTGAGCAWLEAKLKYKMLR